MPVQSAFWTSRTHPPRSWSWSRCIVLLITLMAGATTGLADTLDVRSFQFAWDQQHELLPDSKDLQTVPFKVRRTSTGLAPAVPGQPAIQTDLEAMNRMGGALCHDDTVQVIADALAAHLQAQGFVGSTVRPMRFEVEGEIDEIDVYLIGHLPLDGGQPNPNLPTTLRPLLATEDASTSEPVEVWVIKSVKSRWLEPNPLLVEAASVESVEVRLGQRDARYTSPDNGRRVMVDSIRNFVGKGKNEFDEMAIQTIGLAVASHLRLQGFEQADASATVTGGNTLLIELKLESEQESAPDATSEDDAPAVEEDSEDLPAKTPEVEAPAEDTPPVVEEPVEEVDSKEADSKQKDASEEIPSAVATPSEPVQEMAEPAQENEEEAKPVADIPTESPAPSVDEPDPAVDGVPYMVDPFEVGYLYEHPHLPPTSEFMDLPIVLGYIDSEEGDRNWIAPRVGVGITQTTLNKINAQGGGVFWSSAIAMISSSISRVLISDDLLGVFVIPDQNQISSGPADLGKDLRPPGDTELTIMITVGRVVETRTIAQGDRIDESETFDHETHRVIKKASPSRPHDADAESEEATENRADLIRKEELSDYIHRLNRHPGRNVEASVAASAVPGGVSLDYLVFEADPLTIYYEIGNTGTPQERSLRQRFGLFHSQLTGNDDILSLEYVTSNFTRTNAVLGSYQFRLSDDNRIRGSVIGSWNKFVNDQFGQDFVQYTGYSWSAGGQVSLNIFQDGPFFIDIVPGMNYQKVKVSNELLDDSGIAGFALPYAELQFSRQDNKGLFQAMVGLEGSFLAQNIEELTLLGRIDPAEKWARLNWSASLSTFLEPLFDPVGWADPNTPDSSTLAHEIALRFSGQYSFGSRLVPQFQSILGGLYSVRGYAQSIVAGDNSLFGSIEYRFHLPRTFAVEPEPLEFMGGPFKRAPQHVYGRPDWDLIFKAFFDAGYVFQNGNEGFEVNNTLLGAGIGLEFLYKSNLRVQLDWGFALHDLKFGLAEAGSSRLYVTGTFLW